MNFCRVDRGEHLPGEDDERAEIASLGRGGNGDCVGKIAWSVGIRFVCAALGSGKDHRLSRGYRKLCEECAFLQRVRAVCDHTPVDGSVPEPFINMMRKPERCIEIDAVAAKIAEFVKNNIDCRGKRTERG
ncbi:hypothetical protein P041_02206 [Brucella sp. 04-5288]|nr:hypothetical protein P041_02206 [Brucella sp. 04-5288]